jgi:hypothetical protein
VDLILEDEIDLDAYRGRGLQAGEVELKKPAAVVKTAAEAHLKAAMVHEFSTTISRCSSSSGQRHSSTAASRLVQRWLRHGPVAVRAVCAVRRNRLLGAAVPEGCSVWTAPAARMWMQRQLLPV